MLALYSIEIPEKLSVEQQKMMIELEKEAFPGIGAVDEQTLVPITRYGKMVWYMVQGDPRPVAVGELMRSYNKMDEAYIYGYYVRPDQQGKGVGKSFLKELLNVIKNDGYSSVVLTVDIKNISAVKLYEKLGFVIKETREDEYGDGENRYCMKYYFEKE
jgi:ribosomal protein S18 acetylase RimI-like enzyme